MQRSRLSDHRNSQTFPTVGWTGVKALKKRCSLLRRYFSCENALFFSKFTLFETIVEMISLDVIPLRKLLISSEVKSCAVLSSNTSLLSRKLTSSSIIVNAVTQTITFLILLFAFEQSDFLTRQDFPARTKWFTYQFIGMKGTKFSQTDSSYNKLFSQRTYVFGFKSTTL